MEKNKAMSLGSPPDVQDVNAAAQGSSPDLYLSYCSSLPDLYDIKVL